MGVLPNQGPVKFELFNLSSLTHKIFKVTKHKEKIIFDKIWGYQNGGYPSNEATKILNI